MFVELLLLVFLLIFLRSYVFKSREEKLLAKFPGPRSYPIIGNLLDFDYSKEELTDTLKRLSFEYGPEFLVRIGREPLLVIRSPESFETVLGNTSIIDKANLYWPLYPWLKQGLLTSGGEYWRRHRKIITPTFHFKVLEQFIPVFVKNSSIFVDKMTKLMDQDLDIMPHVALCALDIICESAMGLEINAQQKESKYVQAVNEIQEIVAVRNFNIIHRTFLFHYVPTGRKHDALVKYLHSVTEEVMKERKAKLIAKTSENKSQSTDEDCGIKKKKAFLDMLLEYNNEGAGMTDAEIREEVDTFMFEGYDTTTSTTAFCLYCLSQNPVAQEKAYKEITAILGDDNRDATYQDLLEMKYLEKVIRESLRIYPTVQFVGRQTNKDVQLKSGYTVPANTSITVFIEAMNHDPALHKDPFKFDPERFDNQRLHPYAFVPFAAGPRNCVGQKYAMMEVKTMVSSVLRNFRLLPSSIPITPVFKIVKKSSTGIHLRLEARN